MTVAGVTIATLTGDNGLLQKAANSKQANEKGEIEEQIKLAYNDWKLRKETGETVDLQNTVQTTLDKMYDNAIVNKQGKAISINVKGHEFTLIDDGTIKNGKLAYLDIADGNIDIYSNGYKQYTGNLENLNNNNNITENNGKYIITGTTTENVVRVCEEGKYDITINDLNIDVSNSNKCAFNANRGGKQVNCFVYLTLKGDNHLSGGSNATGLAFPGGMSNVNDVSNASTLTIQGKGKLEAKSKRYGSGIGNGYAYVETGAGKVSNIIINDGEITAIGGDNGAGIGGALNGQVGNITINGGNINVAAGSENIVNNTSMGCLGKELIITGGTIKSISARKTGMCCLEGGSIQITGGNIFTRGKDYKIATYDGETQIPYTPKDSNVDLYETPVKLQGVGENKKVTKLITSDNIEYGINDMYTLENGMLYLYLPAGERTITVEVDGKTYSGAVQTTENPVEVTLNEIN